VTDTESDEGYVMVKERVRVNVLASREKVYEYVPLSVKDSVAESDQVSVLVVVL
jgi:hypothetical protein